MTMVMIMVAVRRQSITLATQEHCHRQLVVEFHVRSSGYIHGQRELSKGIGKVDVVDVDEHSSSSLFHPLRQYFTVPHLFLQESGHSSGIPLE